MNTSEKVKRSNPNIPESTILADQVLHSYSATYTANIATFINSPILVFILWPVVEHHVLLIWLTLVILASLSRGVSAYQYKRADNSAEKLLFWRNRYLVDVFLVGLVWGAAAIWLFPINSLPHQVFLAFVVGGMAAGAVTALSYIKAAVYSYLGLSLIPLLIMFFYSGTELANAMGFMITLYFVMLVIAAKRNHELIKQNICMSIESLERERLLKYKTDQLQTVISSAPIVLWSLDKNGVFTLSEGLALKEMGLKPGQIVGESVFDIYAENPEVINAAKRVLLGETFVMETEVNGRVYMVHYTQHYNEENKIIGCIGVAVDLTERKKAESALIIAKEEAENANRAKSQFLSSMNHELRTPLNAIIGFSQILEMDEKDGKKKKNINQITVAGFHLLSLINQILDLSRIESGEVELSIGNHSLQMILNEVLSMISPLADKRSIQIDDKVSSLPDIIIRVDAMRFKQILLNLLSNAIKYNTEKGSVLIECSTSENKMLAVVVTDTGKGLTSEQLSHLFEPFERFDAANSNIEGTGLGLVIAKDLIELMGGTITAESEVGVGSRFIIHVALA